jgi:pimeloyl-ACP methyl ester carboxylesterase
MAEATNLMIPGPVGKLSIRTKGFSPKQKNVLILVQGANMTGQMGYDFSAPGLEDYSVMDSIVKAGLGAITFSVRGYGLSEPPADPFTVQTDQAIEDLSAVVDWVRAQGFPRPHLLGWSWGGRITGRYVEKNADKIDRLILLDPALGGGPKLPPAPENPWHQNTFDYFKDRLEAEFTDQNMRTTLAQRMNDEELKAPNGIRMELANGTKGVDPTAITRPTLMLYGVAAARQNYMQGGWNRLDFFEKLSTGDKTFSIIPNGGDYAHLQNARHRLNAEVVDFLTAS